MRFEKLDSESIECTLNIYKLEENQNNLEPKYTEEELDKVIKETPERYIFWPQEIPTYDLSESSAFPAFINYEQLEHGDSDTKAQYGDYDVAEDRVWIEDEGEIEYVDSLQESQSSTLTHEVPENVFVIPVYEKSVHTKVPNIPEYNSLPIILTPQEDDEQKTFILPSVLPTQFLEVAATKTDDPVLETLKTKEVPTKETPLRIEDFFGQLDEKAMTVKPWDEELIVSNNFQTKEDAPTELANEETTIEPALDTLKA